MRYFWQEVEFFWNKNRALAWILVLLGMGLALWTGVCPQSPGVSIGLLAGAAGIMSVRPKMHPVEKLAWVVVLVSFTILEVLAIGRADKAAEATRAAQTAAFSAIAEGLKTSIEQSKTQYGSTIEHVNGVLRTTQSVASIARENLMMESGYGSYPCVVPQLASGPAVPLYVFNRGMSNLTGVELKILTIKEIANGGRYLKPAIELGTVSPVNGKPVSEILYPEVGEDGTASYDLSIWTQTGFYTETLEFRKPGPLTNGSFAYKYVLSKDDYPDPSGKIREWPSVSFKHVPFGTNPVPKCWAPRWSDEPAPKPQK